MKLGKILMWVGLCSCSSIVFAVDEIKQPKPGAVTTQGRGGDSKDKAKPPVANSVNEKIKHHREEKRTIKKETRELKRDLREIKKDVRELKKDKNTVEHKSKEAAHPHVNPRMKDRPGSNAPGSNAIVPKTQGQQLQRRDEKPTSK